jgi:type II secretory ATPase GspE/PulE/Tfp pilus assembly ATPase PilB-like protein
MFTDALLASGVLSREELEQAQRIAEESYTPLVTVLLRQGKVSESILLSAYAESHGMEFVALRGMEIPSSCVRRLSAKLASHYKVMPIRSDARRLTIAVSDPLDLRAAEDIVTAIGVQVERVLATQREIEDALHQYYGVGADTVERILATRTGSGDAPLVQSESLDADDRDADASVIRLVNQLLKDAISDRATDLHIERHRSGVVVRRRIDGILYDMSTASNMESLYSSIVSRIKLMAGLNIVERRLPQDGRARVSILKRSYDLRISIVPSMYGEDVVIRVLPSRMLYHLEDLGFGTEHVQRLESYIQSPYGILFVTGPTGSGKSTTLYACLSRLNQRSRKIITIEDPIEYELAGITQTQVNPQIGLTFATSLRSMLRHDPDVMMVGEVRDRETAEIAVQTSMTGHLVLSTLHTNDAAGGAARLIDMGIDPYLITSTVQSFMAQRLVRTICSACRETYEVDGAIRHRGAGCPACNQTGYRGRVAICEFLPMDGTISDMILSRASAHDIRKQADNLGLATLYEDGMRKVESGITTEEELLRVTLS